MRYGNRLTACAAILITCLAWHAEVRGYGLDQASQETGMSRGLIAAVAMVESSRVGYGPWPWTLNVNGRSMYFDTHDDAVRELRDLRRRGVRNVDVGVFQVNLRWNGDLVSDPAHLLDSSVNLWAFVQVVLECQARVGLDTWDVLACYHAGRPDRPHGKQYAQRVMTTYEDIR